VPLFSGWKVPADQDAVKVTCQAYGCSKAGLNPKGVWNPIKLLASPSSEEGSSLSTEPCCAQILKKTKTDCKNLFGCSLSDRDVVSGSQRLPMRLQPKLSSCQAKLCRHHINTPIVWKEKKNLAEFADDGSYQCCVDLLQSNKDRLEHPKDWCQKPTEPIMEEDQCVAYMCERKITNSGDSYANYLQGFKKSGKSSPKVSQKKGKKAAKRKLMQAKDLSSQFFKGQSIHMFTELRSASKSLAMIEKCIDVLADNQLADWSMKEPCRSKDDPPTPPSPNPDPKLNVDDSEASSSGSASSDGSSGDGSSGDASSTEDSSEKEGGEAAGSGRLPRKELEKAEIPAVVCAEGGVEGISLIPGANVLGFGYDPGLRTGCSYEMCIFRPIYKYTFKECKVLILLRDCLPFPIRLSRSTNTQPRGPPTRTSLPSMKRNLLPYPLVLT